MEYSVLMAVYHKDNAQYFEESIVSIMSQTLKTNDFVIVCDGKLSPELDEVIEKYELIEFITIIRLEENIGLGKALNIGLNYCKNELVARMDSDDISLKDRCELQVDVFKKNSDVSFVSGTLVEYNMEYTEKISIKSLPQHFNEIVSYSKKRNPVNHACVMFKKTDVLNVGSYQHFYLHEDYYLWIRLLQNGYKGYNLKEVLLHVRTGDDQIKRRGGYKYFLSAKEFQKFLFKTRYISYPTYLLNVFKRFVSQVLMTNRMRKYFYKKMLRS